MSLDPLVSCSGLAVGYPGRTVLSSVTFSLDAGQSLLVIGHNGAGKSTLLRTLAGILPPISGEAQVLGHAVRALDPRKLMLNGGRFLGQGSRAFPALSVGRNRRVLSLLYGFEPAPDAGPDPAIPPGSRVGLLSIGQRRIEALRLLSSGAPRLILLDEPLSGLDSANERWVLRWMDEQRAAGTAFVVVEQRFRDLLAHFEMVLVLRAGEVTYVGDAGHLLNPQAMARVLL